MKKVISLLIVTVLMVNCITIIGSANWQKNGNGNWSYTKDQKKATSWTYIDTEWYYFDNTGIMKTGWLPIDNQWYYLAPNGAMKKGWMEQDHKWYFLNSSGVMQKKWYKYGDSWYFFNTSGHMQTGWVQYGNSWYYFSPSGEMRTGWISYGTAWYYADDNGEMQTGLIEVNKKVYSFKETGMMETGDVEIGGKTFAFSPSGHAVGQIPTAPKAFDGSNQPTTPTDYSNTIPPEYDPNDTLYVSINGLEAVNLPTTEVLERIVGNEMSYNFEPEALKAQVVAAHSYVKAANLAGKPASVGGAIKEVNKNIKDAVVAVKDKLIYYDDQVINAVYSASSAGYTANAKDTWGTNVPYLVSVESKYDSQDPNWGDVVTLTSQEVRNMILVNAGISLSDDKSDWLKIMSELDGGYVGKIQVDNTFETTGRDLREKYLIREGKWLLKSSCFTVELVEDQFLFTTYGYGHGVGMPQNGANLYAKNDGWDYMQILEHYYKGAKVR